MYLKLRKYCKIAIWDKKKTFSTCLARHSSARGLGCSTRDSIQYEARDARSIIAANTRVWEANGVHLNNGLTLPQQSCLNGGFWPGKLRSTVIECGELYTLYRGDSGKSPNATVALTLSLSLSLSLSPSGFYSFHSFRRGSFDGGPSKSAKVLPPTPWNFEYFADVGSDLFLRGGGSEKNSQGEEGGGGGNFKEFRYSNIIPSAHQVSNWNWLKIPARYVSAQRTRAQSPSPLPRAYEIAHILT